jgi:hypothetical protein
VLAILTIAAACKGKAPAPAPEPSPTTTTTAAVAADAGSAATDWTSTCDETLRTAATIPAPRRALAVIDACRPCGPWTPLLAWNIPPEEGGPTRAAIEQAMAACKGYCDANGKQRFLGNLDPARGVEGRTPWRMLGEVCKDKVSAVPDSRFMSAPYFALDRIARAVGTRPDGAKLLAGVVVPLPALTISGVGIDLPEAPVVKPSVAPAQVTVLDALYASRLPLAALDVDGVHLPADATYPGPAAKDLAAELDKLGDPVLVFAPRNSPAQRLPAAIAKAGKHTLFLGAKASGGPTGWQMYGAVPIQLVAKAAKPGVTFRMTGVVDDLIKAAKAMPAADLQKGTVTIVLGPKTTIAEVARLLGGLAFFDVPTVTLVASP